MDIDELLAKVHKMVPAKPGIRFTIDKCGEALSLFDSKIGGTPYFPKDMEYPRGKKNLFDGQPLTLLAQLNFAQLPHIPDFPEKGILQFFIAGDDLYGMASGDISELADQDNFRVIYHKDIITDGTQLLSPDEIPKYTGSVDCMLPFSGEYKLIPGEIEQMPANYWDHRFCKAFVECYNEFADEPVEEIWEIDEETSNQLYDKAVDYPDAFIGGYPVFVQEDPRSERSGLLDCDVLLFEMDSHYDAEKGIDIMWGDSGTGSFMIPRDRLKALDFSRVAYNFDCG